MLVVIVLAVAASLAIGGLTAVLVRRERRSASFGADGLPAKPPAGDALREARRRARVGRDLTTASTDVYLNDR